MKNLRNYVSYIPKQFSIALVAFTMLLVPFTAMAGFGPERPVFDYNDPEDRKGSLDGPVFNSFINTPNYGDERAFLDAKDASIEQAGGFQDVIPNVQDGQVFTVRAYVHNNANVDTNGENFDGPGVAENTRIRLKMPTATEKNLRIVGFITADNATPELVSDTVEFRNDQAFSLNYVEGSARIKNGVHNNLALGDDIVTDSGALIGYEEMDGNMPGCFPYDALVTIKVKVSMPSLDLVKKVRHVGDEKFVDQVNAKPGDELEWILSYRNDSSQVVKDVTVRDVLPPHLTLVSDSTKLVDAARPNGKILGDTDVFNTKGTTVGNYTPGSNGYIIYRTTVNDDFTQKVTTLTNVAYIRAHRFSEIHDYAKVVVTDKDQPEEPEEPVTPEKPGKPGEEVPEELPNTGIGGVAAGLMGSGALGIGIRSWLSSRRSLLNSLIEG